MANATDLIDRVITRVDSSHEELDDPQVGGD